MFFVINKMLDWFWFIAYRIMFWPKFFKIKNGFINIIFCTTTYIPLKILNDRFKLRSLMETVVLLSSKTFYSNIIFLICKLMECFEAISFCSYDGITNSRTDFFNSNVFGGTINVSSLSEGVMKSWMTLLINSHVYPA